jgi:ABC-type branched-subunit amino acid transport system ATPase component
MSSVLELSGVSKSFGGLKVIDDVSFSVPKGSRTALIGPNGAGKSTVFNLISGVYPVDIGQITALGQDITHMSVAHRVAHGVARSFQNIRLMPHLSTVENVMLGEHHLSSPWSLARGQRASERARAALADAGVADYTRALTRLTAKLANGVQAGHLQLAQGAPLLPRGRDGRRGPALHALHERLDGQAERRGPHHRRLSGLCLDDASICVRLSRG